MPIVILLMLLLFAYVVLNERKVNCVKRRVIFACFLSAGFILVGISGAVLFTERYVVLADHLPIESYYQVLSFCYDTVSKRFPVFIRMPDDSVRAIRFDYVDPRVTNGSFVRVTKLKNENGHVYYRLEPLN